jgi:hypothetical protein
VPRSIPPNHVAGGPPETISGKAGGASDLRKGDRFRGCLGVWGRFAMKPSFETKGHEMKRKCYGSVDRSSAIW